MNAWHPVRGRLGMLSVAALGLFLAQSCFQVEMTTRMEADGTGQIALQMSASRALMEMGGGGGEVSPQDLRFSQEDIEDIRTAADTMPGVRFDTAYSVRDEARSGLFVRFSFDSVGAVQRLMRGQGSDRFRFPALRQTGRTVRLGYRPDPSLASEAGQGGAFGEMGRTMVLRMLDVRFRYVFPAGTAVDTAVPTARMSDSTVVYEWGMRDVLDAAETGDSLFVAATLPEPDSDPGLWIVLGAVLILGGGIVVLLLARRT